LPTHGPDLSRFNLTQLRALTGHAERTLRKRLGDLAPIAQDGRTVWYPARAALEQIYLGEALDLSRERARLARAQSEAQEAKNRRDANEWVPADAFDRALVAFAVSVRDKILAVPIAATPEIVSIVGSPATARTVGFVFDRHLRGALADLADDADRGVEQLEAEHAREAEPGA
jgi:hypothetical protein